MGRSVRNNTIKKIVLVFLLVNMTGCASITIPNYIQDKNPYEKVFYASFDTVREVTTKAFEESGWTVEKESEPALFERERDLKSGTKQTLIFTEVRQVPFFVGSRYARVNAYIHETANNETQVEIRYLTVTSVMFKSFYGYKHDQAVEYLFSKIEKNLDL